MQNKSSKIPFRIYFHWQNNFHTANIEAIPPHNISPKPFPFKRKSYGAIKHVTNPGMKNKRKNKRSSQHIQTKDHKHN